MVGHGLVHVLFKELALDLARHPLPLLIGLLAGGRLGLEFARMIGFEIAEWPITILGAFVGAKICATLARRWGVSKDQ